MVPQNGIKIVAIPIRSYKIPFFNNLYLSIYKITKQFISYPISFKNKGHIYFNLVENNFLIFSIFGVMV